MQINRLFLPLIATLFFLGCSSKEYYSPTKIESEWPLSGKLHSKVKDTTASGAILFDGTVVTHKGLSKGKVPTGFRFIGASDGWGVVAKTSGLVRLIDLKDNAKFIDIDLKKSVAAATVKDDLIAILYVNNEMGIYSISQKKLLFKEQGSAAVAVDTRIINPYFLNELILFLTLDGKMVIVNSESHKIIREMIVSAEDNFNNIIYFHVIGDNLIAATGTRILSLGAKEMRQSYDIRDIIYADDGLYLTTKQGEVIALTASLELKSKRKFPFAHFLGMLVKDEKIYLLEKEGYFIVMDKNFIDYKVYEVFIEDNAQTIEQKNRFRRHGVSYKNSMSFRTEIEGYVFSAGDTFYINDKFITIK